jgi:hypothetical protein
MKVELAIMKGALERFAELSANDVTEHLDGKKEIVAWLDVRESLASRYGTSVGGAIPPGEDVTWRRDIFENLASLHLNNPTSSTAINLMEASLRHPHELVRVAAAAAYYERSSDRGKLTEILEQGTRSIDLLVRQLAATALAQVSPSHPRLSDLQESSGRAAGAAGSAHTAMLIHGTFALGASWWRPGGCAFSILEPVARFAPLDETSCTHNRARVASAEGRISLQSTRGRPGRNRSRRTLERQKGH